MICAAETPGGGITQEVTHNLLTLEQGMLYYNTNLGAVAAVNARDGAVKWVTRYPRAAKVRPDGQDRRAAHFYRDLNPAVYDRGMLYCAPADSEAIFALDAASGDLIWQSHLPEDVVHLLGVGKGNLLASGDRLWWIDARGGKVIHRWPDHGPLGQGRGVLSGDQVLWPTAESLYVFPQDARLMPQAMGDPIDLRQRNATGGGNLVVADGVLIYAMADRILAFAQQGHEPSGASRPLAERGPVPAESSQAAFPAPSTR